jgi:inner membrane protease subunit 2
VKRIIAVEGDIIKTLPPYPEAEVRIPQGHVWVEGCHLTAINSLVILFMVALQGDHDFRSNDSNRFGPVGSCISNLLCFVDKLWQVPIALIDSRLAFILWPLARFGAVPNAIDVNASRNSFSSRQQACAETESDG